MNILLVIEAYYDNIKGFVHLLEYITNGIVSILQ